MLEQVVQIAGSLLILSAFVATQTRVGMTNRKITDQRLNGRVS